MFWRGFEYSAFLAFDQGISRFPADLVIVIAASHIAIDFCALNGFSGPGGDRV